MDTNQWAENLVREVYKEYVTNYSFWKPGLKIFYSPIKLDPDLAIISYQPGGGEGHYKEEEQDSFENSNFQLQTYNSYAETAHRMSVKVRELFGFENGIQILKNSVVFPLIFFRAQDVVSWRKKSNEQRVKMEELSFAKVQEIIKKIRPKKILILGLGTYDTLSNLLGEAKDEKITFRVKNNGRLVVTATLNGIPVFATVHPTGSRISAIDWNLLKMLFRDWILGT